MDFRNFWLLANQKQRETLIKLTGTTENNVRKISSRGYCGNVMALKIATATKQIAVGDKYLRAVPGVSLSQTPDRYRQLLKQIGVKK